LIEGLRTQTPVPEEQYSFAVIKYARFRQSVDSDTSAALSILKEALKHLPYDRVLWETAMLLAEQPGGPAAVANVQALRTEAESTLTSTSVPKDKAADAAELALSLVQHAVDFLDEVASIQEVRSAEGSCAALSATISMQSISDKKRKAATESTTAQAKVGKAADGSIASTGSAATSTAVPTPAAPAATPVSVSSVPTAGAAQTAATATMNPSTYYPGQAYGAYAGYPQQYPMYPAGYQYGQAYPPY
jgi:hypothetical protein